MPVDRMGTNPSLVAELSPDFPWEPEVGDAVAVEVAELVTADPEPELAAATTTGFYARPGSDLCGDPLAR
jgi:hypothetical protein